MDGLYEWVTGARRSHMRWDFEIAVVTDCVVRIGWDPLTIGLHNFDRTVCEALDAEGFQRLYVPPLGGTSTFPVVRLGARSAWA